MGETRVAHMAPNAGRAAVALALASLLLAAGCSGSGLGAVPEDAGATSDGGSAIDGGARDGGPPDGGTAPDAGPPEDGGADGGEEDAGPPAEPPPELAISSETLAALRRRLDNVLAEPALAGHTFSGLIVEAETGTEIWARDPDRVLIPASNTKIFTTAAALDLLGEDHRMLTRVFGSAPVAAGGRLTGDLAIHGEHDFTFSRWFYGDSRFPLDQLAQRLWQRGLREVTGDLHVYGAYLYDGNHFATYDAATHRRRVATAFLAALSARGIVVRGTAIDHASMALPGGEELARWESVPLWVMLWPVNRQSHNEMADILLRHLGYKVKGVSDYPSGAAVVLEWLAARDVPASSALMFDGSGLDTRNRFSSRQMVELYRALFRLPGGALWKTSLSVGGAQGPSSTNDAGDVIVTQAIAPYNGTLAYRLTGANTAGRVFGKSGTNAGITTSGFLVNRYDGRRYVFAFLMNQLPSGTSATARTTQDRLVETVAGDNLDGGTRPRPPSLTCWARSADGASMRLTWTPVPGITGTERESGYFVYASDDGSVWRRERRTFVLDSSWRVPIRRAPVYVRVTAVNRSGESDPSEAYAARGGEGATEILLVDANDRWQAQPVNENVMGAAHAFSVKYATALGARPFDNCSNEAVVSGEVRLDDYRVVLWAPGEDSATHESVSAAEQAKLAAYLEGGGNLFVSAAEMAWDLDPRGNAAATAADRRFLEGVLHAAYGADDAQTFDFEGIPAGIYPDIELASFWTPGEMFVAFPDVLLPADGQAAPCLAYAGGRGNACIQFEGPYRVVALGFPLESVSLTSVRSALLEGALRFFAR